MAEPNIVESRVATLVGAVLIGFGYVSWQLQEDLCKKCEEENCNILEECKFFESHKMWSFVLIMTHAIPFALIPLVMRILDVRMDYLVEQNKEKQMNPFALQLGMACITMSLAFEFGWHVTTAWYYKNEFHLLNFIFYFFLISSFALWADGFYSNNKADLLFAAILLAASILYPIGADKENGSYKIPLYIGMTVTFGYLTWRGKVVLDDWRMLWVPFFSVGVNLFFIFLLQSLDTNVFVLQNYIYHAAHDLLGTEAGVAIFAYLVYDNPRHRAEQAAKKKK